MNEFINVIKTILDVLMTLVLIVGITFIVLFFVGIEPYVVQTGSMEPSIQTGSLSFINKHVKYEDIKENDVIAFGLSTGDKATHRVVKITEEGFETKGDNNDVSDVKLTTKENYIGKNIFSIPKVGYGVKIIQTPKGKIILGTIIVILLLAGLLLGDDKKGKRVKE